MHVPLPAPLKKKLQPTPQWLAVSLPPAQQVVSLRLLAPGIDVDVTHNMAVAALRPFMLRLGVDEAVADALKHAHQPELLLEDSELGFPIGVMRLEYLQEWATAGARIGLFAIVSATHHCMNWPRRVWDSWMYERAVRNVPRETLLMVPSAVEQMLVFYLRPRPVFLVSVDDGQHSNIFPMDLVGPLPPAHFTLALRNTSPSVATIKLARRVALADLPGTACQIAYKLGAHHKRLQVDWNALPFGTRRSPRFALPVPDLAPRVRELEVLDFRTVGSHTLFVGRICSEELYGETDGADGKITDSAARLCHTCGANQRLRARYKRPFHVAWTAESS